MISNNLVYLQFSKTAGIFEIEEKYIQETYKKCFGAKSRYPKLGTSSESSERKKRLKNWTKKHSPCCLKCKLDR